MPEVAEIIEKVMKKAELTKFDHSVIERADFEEVGEELAKFVDVPFRPATISKMLAKVYEMDRGVYKRLGIKARIESTGPMADLADAEQQYHENLRALRAFGSRLNYLIDHSSRFRLVARNLNIMGSADGVPEKFRPGFKQVASAHRTALFKALQNGADVAMYLRVLERDGSPYAADVPLQLMELGVPVYSCDGSEKFGIATTYKLKEGWMNEMFKHKTPQMARKVGMEKERLSYMLTGDEEPTFLEAAALDRYHRSKHTNGFGNGLIEYTPVAVTINTEHFGQTDHAADKPLLHSEASFGVFYWDSLHKYIDRHIRNMPAVLVTKAYLERYKPRQQTSG